MELVQLQWGSALVTALVVVRVSLVGDVVYGPKVKVKPRDQWRSNRRNSNRSNSSRVVSSCSNNRNHSAKLQDSWDAPRRTTVAFVGVAAAVARINVWRQLGAEMRELEVSRVKRKAIAAVASVVAIMEVI